MAQLERIGELEAAMNHEGNDAFNSIVIMAAMAGLGREDRSIITAGREDNGQVALAVEENCFLVYTAPGELEQAGLDGVMIPIRDLLQFTAAHSDDIEGILINSGNQHLLLDQDLILEILDLMGEEDEEEEPYSPPDHIFTAASPGWEWLPEHMAVAAGADIRLSEEAKKTFSHFHYYSNGIHSFALFDDHVGCLYDAVPGEELSVEQCAGILTEDAESSMAESLSYHPDFGKYTMDDGMMAVRLFSGVWCFRNPEDFPDPIGPDHEPTFPVALAMRQELLLACQQNRILLIAMPLGV